MKLSGVSSSVSVLCILTVQASQFRFRMTLALLLLKQTAADWTNLAAFVKFAILRGNISVFKQNVSQKSGMKSNLMGKNAIKK